MPTSRPAAPAAGRQRVVSARIKPSRAPTNSIWALISELGYFDCQTSSMLVDSSSPATAPQASPVVSFPHGADATARRRASAAARMASTPSTGPVLERPVSPSMSSETAISAGQRW